MIKGKRTRAFRTWDSSSLWLFNKYIQINKGIGRETAAYEIIVEIKV
jgi:hypothetical protein